MAEFVLSEHSLVISVFVCICTNSWQQFVFIVVASWNQWKCACYYKAG